MPTQEVLVYTTGALDSLGNILKLLNKTEPKFVFALIYYLRKKYIFL